MSYGSSFRTALVEKLVIFSVFICLSSFATVESFAQGNIPSVNKEFTDFTLNSINGVEVTLSDFRGEKNVVLITFRGWIGYW